MIQPKIFRLAVLISVLLVGCPAQVQLDCSTPSPQASSTKSEGMNIAIHVDGSGSMLGYVTNQDSRYNKAIELLDRVFSLSQLGANSTIKYYRSGAGDQQISRSQLLKAKLPNFYTGKSAEFPGVSSDIASMVNPPEKDKDELIVILTDLYQNGADVTALNKKIQELYLNDNKKDYAVGLIAVKSEFNGKIYLEQSEKLKSFRYNTDSKSPDAYHPFYILLIGPYPKVNDYFNKLKAEGDQLFGDNSKWLIFAPNHLMEKPVDLTGATSTHPPEVISKNSLNDGSLSIQLLNNQPIELLEVKNSNKDKPLESKYSVDFKQNNYTVLLKDIQPIKTVEKFDKIEKKFKDIQLEKALDLTDFKIEHKQKKMNFTTVINTTNFADSGIYQFKIELKPKEILEQDWWKEWSSTDQEEAGEKTNNLLSFLLGLKNITTQLMESNSTSVGKLCYAIQK